MNRSGLSETENNRIEESENNLPAIQPDHRDGRMSRQSVHYELSEKGWKESTAMHLMKPAGLNAVLITPEYGSSESDAGKVCKKAAELIESTHLPKDGKRETLYAVLPACRMEKKYWKYLPLSAELSLISSGLVQQNIQHEECGQCLLRKYCSYSRSLFKLRGVKPVTLPAAMKEEHSLIRWVKEEGNALFYPGNYVSLVMNHDGLHFMNPLYQCSVTLPLQGMEQAYFAEMLHYGMSEEEIKRVLIYFERPDELFVSLLQGCVIE